MNAKWVRRLKAELPVLVEQGVLSPEAADRLRAHYGEGGDRSGAGRAALVVCSVLGALLIGAGIVLVLAHNWSELSRPVRTLVSVAPLLGGYAVAAAGLRRGARSAGWREGMAVYLCMATAAAIALVGQTYHISGNLAQFLLTWMLVSLPAVYVFGAVAPCALYLAGITAWAGYVQAEGGHATAFWGLLALAVPFMLHTWRREPRSMRSGWLAWCAAVCLCVATGIVLEKAMPGLWVPVYAGLFGLFYLGGRGADDTAPAHTAFHWVGAGGIVVLSLLLTYEFAWEHVGWRYLRSGSGYHAMVGWADYAVCLLLAGGAAGGLAVKLLRRRGGALYGVMPVLAAAGFLAVGAYGRKWEPIVLGAFNVYLLALGAGTLAGGVRAGRMRLVNGGLLVLSMLFVARFFDSGMGFVARGLAFIAVGAGFLAVNLLMGRRLKGARA